MSDVAPNLTNVPTSPDLDTHDMLVHSPKQFSDAMTLDLTDEESKRIFQILLPVISKYQRIFRAKLGPHTSFTLDEAERLVNNFEDEIKTRLQEMDVLARVDMDPVYEGRPPSIEIVGLLASHYSARYGMDHEKKQWEVHKAKERGEAFLGAKNLE